MCIRDRTNKPDVIVNGHSRLGSSQPVKVIDDPEALLPGQRVLLNPAPAVDDPSGDSQADDPATTEAAA